MQIVFAKLDLQFVCNHETMTKTQGVSFYLLSKEIRPNATYQETPFGHVWQ